MAGLPAAARARVTILFTAFEMGMPLVGLLLGQALGSNKAVILRNHGLLTVGHSVDAAAFWFISMDRCCQTQMLAEAAGKPLSIDPENATKTRGQVGSEQAGWFSFQPLYARIVREEPDLLE